MRRKQEDGKMMEAAIDKASTLIELLQEENAQLKTKLERLDQAIKKMGKDNEEASKLLHETRSKLVLLQRECLDWQSRTAALQHTLSAAEERARAKIQCNKQLHERLAVLAAKNKELTLAHREDARQALSLKNENQYLLEKLKKIQDKEGQMAILMVAQKVQYEEQIRELECSRQAFSRRCEEQNREQQLFGEVILEREGIIISLQDAHQRINCELKSMQSKSRQYDELEKQLAKMVQNHIGVKAAGTTSGTVEQLSSFVTYRLGHIETLCQSICDKVGIKDLRERKSGVIDVTLTVQRLAAYLSELAAK